MKKKIIIIVAILILITISLFILIKKSNLFISKNETAKLEKTLIKVSKEYVKDKYNFTPTFNKFIYNDYFKTIDNNYYCSNAKIELYDKSNEITFNVYLDIELNKDFIPSTPYQKPDSYNSYFYMKDDYQVPIIKKDLEKELSKILNTDKDNFKIVLKSSSTGNHHNNISYNFDEKYNNNLKEFDPQFYLLLNNYESLENININDINTNQKNYYIYNYKNNDIYEKNNKTFEYKNLVYLKDMIYDNKYVKIDIEDKDLFAFSFNTLETINISKKETNENEILKAYIDNNDKKYDNNNNIYIYLKKDKDNIINHKLLTCNAEKLYNDEKKYLNSCYISESKDYYIIDVIAYNYETLEITITKNSAS